jgi:aspartate aminotransferase
MSVSSRISTADAAFSAVKNFYFSKELLLRLAPCQRRLELGISDFTFGNQHEMPLKGIVAAIRE